MKAIQYGSFGGSGVLELAQVEKPVLKEDEVLIKVKATTVNPFDMKIRSGMMQAIMPVLLPFIPGMDASGIVETVGSKVTRIRPGDEVFTWATWAASYAEYISVSEESVALKPTNVSFNDAAALAVPIATAHFILIEAGEIKPGQNILIQGASGAVGSLMVQMAKALGAYVIGTASGEGVRLIKALGADEAIDYKTQDFTELVKDVDVVADLAGGEALAKSFEVLKRGGKLLSTVMPPSAESAERAGVTAQFVHLSSSYKILEAGLQLLKQGKIKPSFSKVLKLEQAAQAQDLVSAGGVHGKIVLEID